jgi:hypothetical protein
VRDGISARAVQTGSQAATLVAPTVPISAGIADLRTEVAFRVAAGSVEVADFALVADVVAVDVAGSRIQGEMLEDRSRP